MTADSLDRFGGWTAVQAAATGFFRVEEVADRWWFITPEGHGFLSLGVNHIDSSALKYPDNHAVWKGRFGDEETFLKHGVYRDLSGWGFNTIGWSQEVVVPGRTHTPPWRHHQYRWAGLPYCHLLPFSEMELWNKYPRYPDVFSTEFADWCDYVARASCADMADDPFLIGYFYADVPAWGGHPGGQQWPGAAEGDAAGQPADLLHIAQRYYQTIHDAVRRYDPNHLLLGDRYEGRAPLPKVVLDAMAPTVDVVSMQYFPPLDGLLDLVQEWHGATGKPVLLADSAFHLHNRRMTIAGQAERGRLYAEWTERCFQVPCFIGWHWCAYIENLCRRAGLKDRFDEPYGEAIGPMSEANRRVYRVATGTRA